MTDTIRALTIWQPWAWAIVHGWKPVENRTWPCPSWMLGHRLAIHGGKRFDPGAERFVCKQLGQAELPPAAHAQGVLGLVIPWRNLEECPVRATGGACTTCHSVSTCAKARDPVVKSGWLTGPVGWVLRDQVAFEEPIACRGAQGLWVPSPAVLAEIELRAAPVQNGGHVFGFPVRAEPTIKPGEFKLEFPRTKAFTPAADRCVHCDANLEETGEGDAGHCPACTEGADRGFHPGRQG